MADGTTKQIAHIRVGDRVLATEPNSGKTEAQSVQHLITGNGQKHLVRLTVDTDGARGDATGTLTATDNHPLWLADQHSWTLAGEIKPGNRLRTPSGKLRTVTRTQNWIQQQQVFNLTISNTHTYYALAGNTPVLVHNAGGCGEHTIPGLPRPASKITDGPGDCQACAEGIRDSLGGGDLVRFNPPRFFGPYRKQDTMNWTHHWVVVKDGRVYDAFTPRAGETIAEYKAQWDYGDAINFGF
ncbi:polymorphic toxin-type HINT domain-containing protein [Streptomyces sp. NPDC005283]|uniref:polymorphic toxin-type HINT domain-containing protein n=1 Tax=Streptomyces sp. NPDC005283 TaxID=3156871 RepID=UPI003451BCC0